MEEFEPDFGITTGKLMSKSSRQIRDYGNDFEPGKNL